jgi:cell division protein YceG involved in septum cleavage
VKTTTTVKIGKIEISISGISKERVQSSFTSLERELQIQAPSILKSYNSMVSQIDEIHAGSLNVNQNISPADLRKAVAQKVLNSIVQESL